MSKMKRAVRLFPPVIACLVALVLASGCGASRKSGFEDADKGAQAQVRGDFLQTLEEAESHWQKRQDREELEQAIALFEKVVQMEAPGLSDEEKTDKQAEAYERLARGYYFLADAHLRLQGDDESANEEAMMANFEKGVTAAEKAIKLRDPNFASKLAQGESWQDHVKSADPSAMRGVYWYSTNLGKWALLEGVATQLARKDDMLAAMEFVCDTDEQFYYGACHRFFGAYWTKVPFGKDADKSKQHFEKTLGMAPNYLASKVLMADTYAVLAGDRELYDKLIAEVLETPADAIPELAPENHFEKEKARRLQKVADERFK